VTGRSVLPPPSVESFILGAQRYIDAACILIKARTWVDPIGLLASHGLELALKAYLLHVGMSEGEVRTQYGHDLVRLWIAARAHGLAIDSDPPYWLQVISFFHTAPYQYRYPPEGMATVIPPADLFGGMLRDVLASVQGAVASP
jgi:hypothetical protein